MNPPTPLHTAPRTEKLPAGAKPPGAEPLIRPLEEFNRRHLANVPPAEQVNPTPSERYDLVVIGAGPGGAGDGRSGGAARAGHEAQIGAEIFGAPEVTGTSDFAAMRRCAGCAAA